MKKIVLILVLVLFFINAGFCFTGEPEARPPEVPKLSTVQPSKVNDGIDRTMAVPYYDPMRLSLLTKVIGDTAYIKVFNALTQSDEIAIYDDLQILEHIPEVTKIKTYLNSPGGEAYAGFAIADQFRRVKDKYEMSVWASGAVMSAAVMVFAAFDNRFASPSTMFMVHEFSVSQTAGMNRTDIENMRETFGQLTDRYVDILVGITNKCKEDWEKMLIDETNFFAPQAKEWGLVTEVK